MRRQDGAEKADQFAGVQRREGRAGIEEPGQLLDDQAGVIEEGGEGGGHLALAPQGGGEECCRGREVGDGEWEDVHDYRHDRLREGACQGTGGERVYGNEPPA